MRRRGPVVYFGAMRRDTRQRRILRQVLEQADRPLSPQEILEASQGLLPGLGIATVYRNVKAMVEEGTLQAVELPGEGLRYELAGKLHHHHFHCRGCGKVYEVEGCPGDLGPLAPPEFRVESHMIVLYGRCADCTPANCPQLLASAAAQEAAGAAAKGPHRCSDHGCQGSCEP